MNFILLRNTKKESIQFSLFSKIRSMAAFSRKIHAVNSNNARYNSLIVIKYKEFQLFLWYVSTHEKVAKTLEYECCYRFQNAERCDAWAKNDYKTTKFPLDFFWKHDVYYYQRNRFRKMKERMYLNW